MRIALLACAGLLALPVSAAPEAPSTAAPVAALLLPPSSSPPSEAYALVLDQVLMGPAVAFGGSENCLRLEGRDPARLRGAVARLDWESAHPLADRLELVLHAGDAPPARVRGDSPLVMELPVPREGPVAARLAVQLPAVWQGAAVRQAATLTLAFGPEGELPSVRVASCAPS